MAVCRILRAAAIGETWWLALDERDRPVSLHLERPASDAKRACLGERLDARVKSISASLGGVFLDLDGKPDGAFLRNRKDTRLHEGEKLAVDIAAEARGDKLARAVIADGAVPLAGTARWQSGLAGGASAVIEDTPAWDAAIAAAIETALSDTYTLDGGGKLTCERARALTAADIDTAGRAGRGSAASRALSINTEAAAALARKAHLAGLGGLLVLDCVGPLNRAAGEKVREAFVSAWASISREPVRALAPSPFGLMQISAPWTVTPLSERMHDRHGQPTAETLAVQGLTALEKAACEDRLARLVLRLPRAAMQWMVASGLEAGQALAAKYGARCVIDGADIDTAEVSRT